MQIRFTYLILFSFLLSCLAACSDPSVDTINDVRRLSKTEKQTFTNKIIRLLGEKPEDASNSTKFHSFFDSHYKSELKKYTLTHFYKSEKGKCFFVYTTIAPSIYLKKIAIGGTVTFDNKGEVLAYNELFRTWKQTPEKLQPISEELFVEMVLNKSLEDYQTKSSQQLGFIEFPNSEVSFDSKTMQWISTREDPLAAYAQGKIARTNQKIKEYEKNKLKK